MSSDDAGAPDRRSSARIPAEMWVEENSGDGRYFRRAGNLSSGGLRLDRSIPLPVGSTVNLSFTLPGESSAVEVTAEVVSVDAASALGMGVKFVNLDPAAQARIDAYLARVVPGG